MERERERDGDKRVKKESTGWWKEREGGREREENGRRTNESIRGERE